MPAPVTVAVVQQLVVRLGHLGFDPCEDWQSQVMLFVYSCDLLVELVEAQVLEQAGESKRAVRAAGAAIVAALRESRHSVFPRDWCDLEREWREDGGGDGGGCTVDTERAGLVARLGSRSTWASEPARRAATEG